MPAMEHRPLSPWHPAALIATGLGSGYLPWAPGTWGSLAALLPAWLIAHFLGRYALIPAAIIVFLLGWWAAGRVQQASGVEDAGSIVIDEIAGQWLTLAVAPLDPLFYGAGFVLFRLFDITKPWPARWADRHIPGGLGVMADDVIAGVYAAIALDLILAVTGVPQ